MLNRSVVRAIRRVGLVEGSVSPQAKVNTKTFVV